MHLDDLFGYYTPKVVFVRNRNLGILRLVLVLAILVYIIYEVILLEHRYNYEETPLGTVEVSLQAPDQMVDPAQFRYCDQYSGNDTEPVLTKRRCFVLHALEVLYPFETTGGVFVTTRINTQENVRACELDQACRNQYTPSAAGVAGFVADVESFTLRIRHSMQALKLFQEYHSPAYGGNSDMMVGRLISSNGSLVKYITSPIFSVGELLAAANTRLEDRSDALGENSSMRDAGVVLLVTLAYSNVETPLPIYDMQVTRVAFSEYKITHLDRLNGTTVSIVGLHGIKIVFVQTGTIVRFDFQVLLMSLVTSTALLACATSVVEFIMLRVSPLREVYMKAKYEPTMEIHELAWWQKTLRKQTAMKDVKDPRLLQLSQFAFLQYRAMDNTPSCSKEEIDAITRSIQLRQERALRKQRKKEKATKEEKTLLSDKQFLRPQHEQLFVLLAQDDGLVPQRALDLLLSIGGTDLTTKQMLAENGLQGELNHDQFVDFLTFLGQLEKVKIGAGAPCVQLFGGANALDRLLEKLARHPQLLEEPPRPPTPSRTLVPTGEDEESKRLPDTTTTTTATTTSTHYCRVS